MTTGRQSFVFVLPIWGESYVDFFLRYTLPALLSPNNLPAVAQRADIIFEIMTTPSDLERLQSNTIFQQLTQLASIKITPLTEAAKNFTIPDPSVTNLTSKQLNFIKENKYSLQDYIYRMVLQNKTYANPLTYICCIVSDVIYADGFWNTMADIGEQGYDCVACLSARTVRENILSTLEQWRETNDTLVIPKRAMTKLAIQNLHPIYDIFFLQDREKMSTDAHQYMWRVDDNGIIIYTSTLQPIMYRSQAHVITYQKTIDHDFITRLPDIKKVYYLNDSDNAMSIEVSPQHYIVSYNLAENDPDPQTMRMAMLHWANLGHLHFLKQPLRLHFRDIDKKWQKIEAQAQAEIDALVAPLESFLRTKQLVSEAVAGDDIL